MSGQQYFSFLFLMNSSLLQLIVFLSVLHLKPGEGFFAILSCRNGSKSGDPAPQRKNSGIHFCMSPIQYELYLKMPLLPIIPMHHHYSPALIQLSSMKLSIGVVSKWNFSED